MSPAGTTGSMSADLFDFHRGGDGIEQMNDGEKRKLTRLNPMRNVGFAVRNFFFHTASHHSLVSFQLLTPPPSSVQTLVMEILQGLNSAHRVVTPPAQKMRCCLGGGGDQRQWWMMTMWEQFSYVDEILSGALHDLSSEDKMVKKRNHLGGVQTWTSWNVAPARYSANKMREIDVKT